LSILNIRFRDTFFASIADFRALQARDQRVHHILDLLPTHAFLEQFFQKQFLIKILYITPTLYAFVNKIFLVIFTDSFLNTFLCRTL
jgi:hypothetical protein